MGSGLTSDAHSECACAVAGGRASKSTDGLPFADPRVLLYLVLCLHYFCRSPSDCERLILRNVANREEQDASRVPR